MQLVLNTTTVTGGQLMQGKGIPGESNQSLNMHWCFRQDVIV